MHNLSAFLEKLQRQTEMLQSLKQSSLQLRSPLPPQELKKQLDSLASQKQQV